MKFAKALLFLSFVICANAATAQAFYAQNPAYQSGNWTYGCNLYTAAQSHAGQEWWKTNFCYVNVPSGASGVLAYGINHSADGWSHWTGESPFWDGVNVDDSWGFHGPAYDQANLMFLVKHDTLGILYWDEICDYHGFWYQNTSEVQVELEHDQLCEWGVHVN